MANYERRKCSQCGEGLGFSEDDPCDKCWLENQPTDAPQDNDTTEAAKQ